MPLEAAANSAAPFHHQEDRVLDQPQFGYILHLMNSEGSGTTTESHQMEDFNPRKVAKPQVMTQNRIGDSKPLAAFPYASAKRRLLYAERDKRYRRLLGYNKHPFAPSNEAENSRRSPWGYGKRQLESALYHRKNNDNAVGSLTSRRTDRDNNNSNSNNNFYGYSRTSHHTNGAKNNNNNNNNNNINNNNSEGSLTSRRTDGGKHMNRNRQSASAQLDRLEDITGMRKLTESRPDDSSNNIVVSVPSTNIHSQRQKEAQEDKADYSRAKYGYNLGLTNEALVVSELPMASVESCLLYTSPSPRDRQKSRMPSSA